MNKTKLLAAVCCTAMLFAACEKSEPTNNSSEDPTIFMGTENGYEWVDLGLSVKWATCNLGATKPEEYGNYYAWGEIATKSDYSWSTYKYGTDRALTKYCNDSGYGIVDKKAILEATDDAAIQNWGGNWRMPTDDEWQELIDNCTLTWTTLNGVNGCEVKAINGSSIFLPAAGYRNNVELCYAGSFGEYWSNSLATFYPDYAYFALFYSDYHNMSNSNRDFGRSVRPVVE